MHPSGRGNSVLDVGLIVRYNLLIVSETPPAIAHRLDLKPITSPRGELHHHAPLRGIAELGRYPRIEDINHESVNDAILRSGKAATVTAK